MTNRAKIAAPSESSSSHLRKSVAITHVRLGWGGSEKRVLWGIQALREEYDITLVTAGDFDLNALNEYYGTSLGPQDFNVVQVPLPSFMRRNAKAAAIRGALFQRYCQKVANQYDVLISGYGPTDFGRPAIHMIADFSWDDEIREALHPYPPGLIYQSTWIRKFYLYFASLLRKPTGRNLFLGEDLMVAVSPWVARSMKERFGVDCPVIYSPVPGTFPKRPWEEKQHGFVCLGRLAPEKRIEQIIAILDGVRAKGHDIHLHIIGGSGSRAYNQILQELCAVRSDWISMEGKLFGAEKTALLSEHRFGIHACHGDAFPGVLIEMMKAGCVVWAHRSGGQIDILEDEDLLYENVKEAVEKIHQVLIDPVRQQKLQQKLVQLAEKYSVKQFMEQIRILVADWSSG